MEKFPKIIKIQIQHENQVAQARLRLVVFYTSSRLSGEKCETFRTVCGGGVDDGCLESKVKLSTSGC